MSLMLSSSSLTQSAQPPTIKTEHVKTESIKSESVLGERDRNTFWGELGYLLTTPVCSATQAFQLGMVREPKIPHRSCRDPGQALVEYQAVPVAFICSKCFDRGYDCCWMVVDRTDRRCVSCLSSRETVATCEASSYELTDKEHMHVPVLMKDPRPLDRGWLAVQQSAKRAACFTLCTNQPIASFDDGLKIKADLLEEPAIATRYAATIPKELLSYRERKRRRTLY